MPRFAANLTLLFNEVPFLDRFECAAQAGFEAVEFLFPYEHEPAEIAERLRAHGLCAVLHNLPPGDWAAGERGLACLPDRTSDFRASVAQGIAYARALHVPQLNCLAGIPGAQMVEAHWRPTLVANLRHAAHELAKLELRLLIEPINHFDMPGYAVTRSAQAIDIMDEVGAPNLFLQYDIYHAQRMEGELIATMTRLLPRIGHMQLADNPGRHEPGTGEIGWDFVLAQIDRMGYAGWIGCEYRPLTTTQDGLAWLARWRSQPR
jgi:hydroxypyruvate isomerase